MFEWLFGKKKERKKTGDRSDRSTYMDGYATTSAYLNSDNNFDASIDPDDRKAPEDSNSGGESSESNDSGDSGDSGSSDSSGGDSSD